MTILLDTKPAPYVKRMIKCPGHFLIPPKVDVYLREPVSWLKEVSNFVEVRGQKIKIKKDRIRRDKYGSKMVDWRKIYKLRDAGIVSQPDVSAAWVIENIYDPMSELCQLCPKFCKEGQGRVLTQTIKRLNGHYRQ